MNCGEQGSPEREEGQHALHGRSMHWQALLAAPAPPPAADLSEGLIKRAGSGRELAPRPRGLSFRRLRSPMASLAQFAGWLATQVFDVVGSVAGLPAADGGGAYSDTVDLQVGKTVYHDVPASVSAGWTLTGCWEPGSSSPLCRAADTTLCSTRGAHGAPARCHAELPLPSPPCLSLRRCARSCGSASCSARAHGGPR